MNNEQQLLAIADKLNVGVDHLWAVLVQQAHYSAILYFLSILFFIGALAYWLFSLRFYLDKTSMEKDTKDFLFVLITALLVAVNIIVIPISFAQVFVSLTNPEFWALDYLLSSMQ